MFVKPLVFQTTEYQESEKFGAFLSAVHLLAQFEPVRAFWSYTDRTAGHSGMVTLNNTYVKAIEVRFLHPTKLTTEDLAY